MEVSGESPTQVGGWVVPKSGLDILGKKKNLLSLLGFKLQITLPLAKLLYLLLP